MADDSTVPVDTALPSLSDFAASGSPPNVVVAAAEELTGMQLSGARPERSYVRYWPGRRCVVQWSFQTGQVDPVLVSSELLSEREASRGRAGQGRYLSEDKTWVQVFPHDRVLPAIAKACSPSWIVERLLPGLGENNGDVHVASAGYKSWRRCVLRYDIGSRRYYAKLFRDERGEALLQVQRSLSEEMRRHKAGWEMPEPLLYDAETQMLVSAELKGAVTLADRLRELAREGGDQAGLMEEFGAACRGLTSFQELKVDGLQRFTSLDVLGSLEDDAEDVSLVAPGIGELLERRLERLAALRLSAGEERLAVAHGAFRYSHVYLSDRGLAFLDLDNVRLSDRNSDAGYFLAYLAFRGLQRRRTRDLIEASRTSFAETWRQQPSYSPAWLSFHYQAVLLKWAIRAFFSLEGRWRELIERVDGLCSASENSVV